MLTALILMVLFGGGSAEIFSRSDFRMVEATIEETARAEVAVEAMERINDHLDSVVQQRREIFEQLDDMDIQTDTSADDYNEVLDQLWGARAEARSKYVEDVFVLRDNITRDEWHTVFGDPSQ